jgi:hypothetical protein
MCHCNFLTLIEVDCACQFQHSNVTCSLTDQHTSEREMQGCQHLRFLFPKL